MRHPSEGQLMATVDGALAPHEADRVRQHVQGCVRCSTALADLTDRRAGVASRMQLLTDASQAARRPVSPQAGRRRLAALEAEKDREAGMPLLKTWFSKRYRPVWAALVVVMALGLSLLSPPIRALAGNFLNLFRVQKIEVVGFDPSAVLGEGGLDSAMRSLETVMDEQVTVSMDGEPQTVDEGTLRSLSSIRVRMPQAVEGEPHYALQPAATIAVQVDLPRIQALLSELGYGDIELPASLDGADVEVALNPLVVAAYGVCRPNTEAWAGAHGTGDFDGPCTVLMQMRSPTVSGPAGLDVDQLGQAYLQLLGMSAGEARRFSERLDWTATLVLPLPRTEVSYEELMVDGVMGVLVRPTHNRLPRDEYVLMWVKDDIVYGLSGTGSATDAVRIADSLD